MLGDQRQNLLAGLLASTALTILGCGSGDSGTLAITRIDMTDEQAAEIRSHDQMVDEEEGGAQKITRATRPTKAVRTAGQSR